MESSEFGLKTPSKISDNNDSLADHFGDSEISTLKLQNSIVPDISEWNIVKSAEKSLDGRTYKAESLATTEGVQKLDGGHAEFAGRSEQMKKASHQGDDKNYVKTAEESSKTQLQENVVIGDEKTGRIQQKASSVTSFAQKKTSKMSSSSGDVILDPESFRRDFDELLDSDVANHISDKIQKTSNSVRKEHKISEQHREEVHQRKEQRSQQTKIKKYVAESATDQDHSHRNLTNEEIDNGDIKVNSMLKDVDLSEILSGESDPNTMAIIETKKLPDGTIVTTKKYETKSSTTKSWSSQTVKQQVQSRVEESVQKVVQKKSMVKENMEEMRTEIEGLKL